MGALLCACGSSKDKPPPVTGGPTVGDDTTQIMDAVCERVYTACQETGWYGTDLASCETDAVKDVCDSLDCTEQSYAPTWRVDQCVADVETFSCAAIITPDWPSSCNAVIKGHFTQ